MKKELERNAQEFRNLLQALGRDKLSNKESKLRANKATDIKEGAMDSMLYRKAGGLDAWVTLLTYLYDIKTSQLSEMFLEIKEFLRKKRKLPKAQLLWADMGDKLSDDRKHFWCDIIKAIEPSYEIKRKKRIVRQVKTKKEIS